MDEPSELQEEIITLVAENPDANSREIAEMAGCAPSTVRRTWNEFEPEIAYRMDEIYREETGIPETTKEEPKRGRIRRFLEWVGIL